jgi:hypothetical protein
MDGANLSFLCPITKCGIDSGFDVDNDSRVTIAEELVRIACPHCGQTHEFHMYSSFGRLNEPPEQDKPRPA